MHNVLTMLLAGGRGSRLNILGAHRAKPAVPFAGLYRIIDFALSNCMYGRLLTVGVLTQYRPISLLAHLGNGSHWDMAGRSSLLKNLPPYQASADFDWYHGTADAVYQNLSFIRRHRPNHVVILSGDHIYRMDYERLVDFHRDRGAALTVAAMPVPPEETHRFGIIVADDQGEVVEFQEKPKVARSNLASMGIYVFDTDVLVRELERCAGGGGTDFGHHVIPGMLGTCRIVLTPGTGIDLFDWKVSTNLDYEGVKSMGPACVLPGGSVSDSLVSPGCTIRGRVEHSILSPGVVVEKGAVVRDAIVMHRSVIGREALLERTIVDKHCTIGPGARLCGSPGGRPNEETPDHLATGLVVVGRNSLVPESTRVGTNVIIHPEVGASDWSGDLIDGATLRPAARY